MPVDTKLVRRFVETFLKAISLEMDAMRERLGPFEVTVRDGKPVEGQTDPNKGVFSFRISAPNEKLVLGTECTLRNKHGEWLVTIMALNQERVTVSCDQKIRLDAEESTLVIYPWFLYERLMSALSALPVSDDHFLDKALLAFGKLEPVRETTVRVFSTSDLNESQNRAVQLCNQSNLAFVWGPPGTGKTTTLAHIVSELLQQGLRILITSTTNAAIDQVLGRLVRLDCTAAALREGQIVRVGQMTGQTHGASVPEVVARRNETTAKRLKSLRARLQHLQNLIPQCKTLSERLAGAGEPDQMNLFGPTVQNTIKTWHFAPIFSEARANQLVSTTVEVQSRIAARREKRLARALQICQDLIIEKSRAMARREKDAVHQARIVLATMTNMYVSSLLSKERFDAIIIEEAGMAILPTIFYCASLAKDKVIFVGDPKQLPPIVQSRDDYVRKTMGRNIFEVAIPDSKGDRIMVMLDTQYRMHPQIGNLVSRLFYEGGLINAEETRRREDISQRKPYPGKALVVVDTNGQTVCTKAEGQFSRKNEESARICLNLALEGVRDGIESVAIITPYTEQARLIGKLLRDSGRHDQIECSTVHKFQGNERDMVIFDVVDDEPLRPGVLLSDKSRGTSARNFINVGISRAKGKLIIVANTAYFDRHDPSGIISTMLRESMKTGSRQVWEPEKLAV